MHHTSLASTFILRNDWRFYSQFSPPTSRASLASYSAVLADAFTSLPTQRPKSITFEFILLLNKTVGKDMVLYVWGSEVIKVALFKGN